MFACDLVRVSLWVVLTFGGASSALSFPHAISMAVPVAFNAIATLPVAATRILARATYVRVRGRLMAAAWLAGGVVVAGAWRVWVPEALGSEAMGALLHRPTVGSAYVHVLLPLLRRLSVRQQLCASIGTFILSHLMYTQVCGSPPGWGHCAWVGAACAVAALSEWRMRRQYCAVLRMQQCGRK